MQLDSTTVSRRMMRASVAIVCLLAFAAPIASGCLAQRHWTIMAGGALVAGAVALFARAASGSSRLGMTPALACLLGLLALVVLQLVPLPSGLVALVSPGRASIAREIAATAGEDAPSWIPLTSCLDRTRDAALLLGAYIAVFYASSSTVASGGGWRMLFGATAAGGALLALYGIAALAAAGERLRATFVNPNRFAAYAAIAASCALALFVARNRSPRTTMRLRWQPPPGALTLAAAIVIEIALLLTLSRLGIAAALVAGLLTIALFSRRRAVWVALTGVLVVLAINAALAIDPVLGRYSILFDHELHGNGRLVCWWQALPMIPEYPLVGSGARSFSHVFRLYQQPSLPGWWTYAHNDYLNLLTDTGVAGLGLAAAAVALGLRSVVRLRSSSDRRDRAIALAAFLSGTMVLIHSLGDFPLQEPAVALAFFAVVGCAHGRAQRTAGATPVATGSPWPRTIAVAAVLSFVVVALPTLVALRASATSKDEATRVDLTRDADAPIDDLDRRLRPLESACRLDPWDSDAHYEAARTLVALMKHGSPGPLLLRDIDRAKEHIRAGRASSQLDPRPYYLAGVLAWRPTAQGLSDQLMGLALKMAPGWHDVSYQVGSYFLQRWLQHARDGSQFALSRWGRTVTGRGGREERRLFGLAARALSHAARSPLARRRTVELAIRSRLSAREIDALLAPDARTQAALAFALARVRDHVAAGARFVRAIEHTQEDDPALPGLLVGYAGTLLAGGELDDATSAMDQAIALSEGDALRDTVRRLARLRAPPGAEAALAEYWEDRAARLGGVHAAVLARAEAELAAGREREGLEHMMEYARLASDAGTYERLARTFLRRREASLASVFTTELTRLQPDRAANHVLHGNVLRALGNERAAAASFASALGLEPANATAARALADVERKLGNHERAIATWRSFIDAGGDEVAGRAALAEIYLGLLDRRRAADELRKALDVSPGDARLEGLLREAERGSTDAP